MAIKVTQEKRPDSQVSLQIEVSADVSRRAYDQTLQRLTREVNLPGFRKGKVPRNMLIQRFGETRIRAMAVEELVRQHAFKAAEESDIKVIGEFDMLSPMENLVDQFSPDQPFVFSVVVDVHPEVTLKQYSGFNLKVLRVQPDFERLEKLLSNKQHELATLIPIEDRPAQMGDAATISYTGRFAEGVEPSEDARKVIETTINDFQLDLVKGRFIDDLIEGIVGMTIGEVKDIAFTFPEDYAVPGLAGLSVIFNVTLTDLKEKELPPLDDTFAQQVSNFSTMAELRQSLEKKYIQEAENKTAENKRSALLKELVKHVEVEIPKTLLERETSSIIGQAIDDLQQNGFDIDLNKLEREVIGGMRQEAIPMATERLKQAFAMDEIARRESISVNRTQLNARVKEAMAASKGQKISREQWLNYFEVRMLQDEVLAWLEANSNLELVDELPEDETMEDAGDVAIAEKVAEVAAQAHAEVVDAE